jgi:hypothetical protein
VRYDTMAAFTTAGSWLVVHAAIATGDPDLASQGAIYDGHYVYFLPSIDVTNAKTSVLARLDPTAPDLTAAAAWTTFDTLALDAQATFAGGAFDGRFVYFVPSTRDGSNNGDVIRYDTAADFAAAPSWSSFDTGTLDTTAAYYYGAVFDGRYVYLEPDNFDGAFARFDAVEPAAEPALPDFHGSFL